MGRRGLSALTDVRPGPDGPQPLLILDQRPEPAVRSGLSLVTTPSERPAPAPGWRLELSATRAARLTAPDGSLIWAGECGQPRPWRELITRTSRCVVLIGAIGLWTDAGERPPARIETLLDQAAQAEELAGGLVEAAAGDAARGDDPVGPAGVHSDVRRTGSAPTT